VVGGWWFLFYVKTGGEWNKKFVNLVKESSTTEKKFLIFFWLMKNDRMSF
jgi:hypothetical protein